MEWQKSKKSVGGDPVRAGAEGVVFVPGDCRLAVGYVWQKGQIDQLGQQIRQSEHRLGQLRTRTKGWAISLPMLRSPMMLEQRVRELNLGLAPAQPSQVWRLATVSAPPENDGAERQFAARQDGAHDAMN